MTIEEGELPISTDTSTDTTVTYGDADLESVRDAREAARSWLASHHVTDDLAERTVLVVSELVTNAVRHAASGWVLAIERRSDGTLQVRVTDTGPGEPRIPSAIATREATSGRGLALVAELSDAWGWHRSSDGGKVVWADLA